MAASGTERNRRYLLKAKGSAFENTLVPLAKQYYPFTIRGVLRGAKDRGDLYMPGNDLFIVEAKCQMKQAMPLWMREAEIEAENASVPFGVVVHKRRGTTAPEDQWATMTFGKWLQIVHRMKVCSHCGKET